MTEPEYFLPSQLRPGPIRNESLPPELLDQIKEMLDVIGQYIGMTLELRLRPHRSFTLWSWRCPM